MKVSTGRPAIRVPGFEFAGVRGGIKESKKRDIAVIRSVVPAAAAASFTTNRVKAAPVHVGIEHVRDGRLQAVVVNSGNANAYTGRDGLRMAKDTCTLVASELGVRPQDVLPSSTGRIGVQLPRIKVERGVRSACRQLSPDGFHEALEGIMTTDAFPKFAAEAAIVEGAQVVVAGMAKGAGMIAPRMRRQHATMLSYIFTDAAVTPAALRKAIDIAQADSFNTIIVDGDTSTNDTLLLMANGMAGNRPLTQRSPDFAALCGAVAGVCAKLSRMIVQDGEGATKVVDIRVRGARNIADAERAAEAVARSPLCKTAFYGSDPYMGRVVCAIGYSGAVFDPNKVDVYADDLQLVKRGVEVVGTVEKRAHRIMSQPEFTLTIDLKAGRALAHRVTSDLSVEYVHFNSAYRT